VRAWHADYPDIVVVRTSGRSQTINVDDALAELAERIAARQHSDALAAVNSRSGAPRPSLTSRSPTRRSMAG
jgi:protein subunit release factor A